MRYELTDSQEALFWAKVDKSGECWLWTAGTDRKGYGLFGASSRRTRAHRVSFCLAGGDIPEGDFVLHDCDTPACVNPAHLYTGDHAANMRDRRKRGRTARGRKIPQAKLTARLIEQIRAEWDAAPRTEVGWVRRGWIKAAAARYGIHPTHFRMIGKRRAWVWVE